MGAGFLMACTSISSAPSGSFMQGGMMDFSNLEKRLFYTVFETIFFFCPLFGRLMYRGPFLPFKTNNIIPLFYNARGVVVNLSFEKIVPIFGKCAAGFAPHNPLWVIRLYSPISIYWAGPPLSLAS